MRVRINGPSKLEKFPALKYAKKWYLEEKRPLTDTKLKIKNIHWFENVLMISNDDMREDDDDRISYISDSSLF